MHTTCFAFKLIVSLQLLDMLWCANIICLTEQWFDLCVCDWNSIQPCKLLVIFVIVIVHVHNVIACQSSIPLYPYTTRALALRARLASTKTREMEFRVHPSMKIMFGKHLYIEEKVLSVSFFRQIFPRSLEVEVWPSPLEPKIPLSNASLPSSSQTCPKDFDLGLERGSCPTLIFCPVRVNLRIIKKKEKRKSPPGKKRKEKKKNCSPCL